MKQLKKWWILDKAQSQKGQVLLIVILLLAVVSIILLPLLNFMGTGLKEGYRLEQRAIQLSGADSGQQSAWQVIHEGKDAYSDLPITPGDAPYTYTIDTAASGAPALPVSVTITLTASDIANKTKTYNVLSTCSISSGTTTISATLRAQAGDYAYFMDNIFTTRGEIYLKNGVEVNGFTQCAGFSFKQPVWGLNPNPPPEYFGDKSQLPTGWPSAQQLRDYFQNLDNNLHVGTWVIPSGYHFTTTEYVQGNCEISEIYLDGQTLFVDGSFLNPPNKDVIVHGPGCVVATGNITFGPKMAIGDPSNGVLCVALGTADFSPSSDFYGWIAAEVTVLSKQGSGPSYNWLPPNYDLNFPNLKDSGGSGNGVGKLSVLSWEVSLS